MLSSQSRPVIEATLPVVGEHIEEIAARFYKHLFSNHPELLDGTFNRGNQVDGSQQRALAGSVAGFATALVTTPGQVPEKLLSRIAHKHASLGIRPDQYQVVHDNLMWAIVDVLGEAVTPEVAAAWDEVYWLMANALINQERGLYSARGVRPETVWRQWQVEKKIRETEDVVTFVVKRIDDRLVKTSLPGPVRDRADADARRGAPAAPVQPDPGRRRRTPPVLGQAGARQRETRRRGVDAAARRGRVGDVLTLSLPFGDVVLDDAGRPVVFISAGIGITPMAGMLSHLVAAGSGLQIMMLHADVHEGSFALRRQVVSDVLALRNASIHLWYANGTGSNEPVDGRPRRTDGPRRGHAARQRLVLPVRADPVHAGGAQRADRTGVAPRDIQYEVSAPTYGRPTSTERSRVRNAGFAAGLIRCAVAVPAAQQLSRVICGARSSRSYATWRHRRFCSGRSSEVAAGHREHGPGDVGGLVGGEEGDRRGLLVQGPVPLEQR